MFALSTRGRWGCGKAKAEIHCEARPAANDPFRKARPRTWDALRIVLFFMCLLSLFFSGRVDAAPASGSPGSLEKQRHALRMVGYNEEEIEEIVTSPQGLYRVNSRIRIRMMGFTKEEAYQLVPRQKDLMARAKGRVPPLPSINLVERVLRPYDAIIKKTAIRHRLPEALVRAVIICESGGDALAVSPKGAMGLMQLMPGTALELGVERAFDAPQNIEGGCSYLKKLWDEFSPRWDLTLAAYNAGPARVREKKRIPNFSETKSYVKRVLSLAEKLEKRV